MRRLSKEESRKRWSELRAKWNEYDPIGVMSDPDCPLDEYEAYVGPTMRLLEQGATIDEIADYLSAVSEHMGLSFDRARARKYSVEFIQWYRWNWRDTMV